MRKLFLLNIVSVFFSCAETGTEVKSSNSALLEKYPGADVAVFAGGCFWCMEGPFESLDGVFEVLSGYTGGTVDNPTYEQVSSGSTGHLEAVIIYFDSKKISYEKLLEVFWRQIDPTDAGGSFFDRGSMYMSAIFYLDDEQKKSAEKSKNDLDKSKIFDKPIVTGILKFEKFFLAEKYHQNFYKKNNGYYKKYRKGSGRDKFIKDIWDLNND